MISSSLHFNGWFVCNTSEWDESVTDYWIRHNHPLDPAGVAWDNRGGVKNPMFKMCVSLKPPKQCN